MSRILLLSTRDAGGAGLAYLKETELLRNKGADAKLVVLYKYNNSTASVGLIDGRSLIGRTKCLLHHVYCKFRKLIAFGKADRKYIMFDVQIRLASARRILKLYGSTPDIIMVGWVTDFVSVKTIKKLEVLTGAKVLYSMVDNAPIGGGCHYPWDCKGYTSNCFPCPALKASNRRASKTLLYKQRFITPEMAISGTTNDISRARESALFHKCQTMVSFSLQPNPYVFSREEGRSFFGITDDRYVVLCGADSISAERKGFKELIESLEVVKQRIDISGITILVAGGQFGGFPSGYDIRFVGRLSFEDLFRAYSCADVFLCPSLEDSGPMMINYGVMAYIPVVAYKMGIAQDVIRHKENGYIARWRDVYDFAEGILYCIANRNGALSNLKALNDRIMIRSQAEDPLRRFLGVE